MKKTAVFFFFILLSSVTAWAQSDLKLTSPAFQAGGDIPSAYTCDGKNISPALKWENPPRQAASQVVIVEDPDAPSGDWVHWVLFNIPPTINNLPEALPPIKTLANGEIHGQNDFKKLGYDGPCPPSGSHRYYFRLYALDNAPRLSPGTPKAELLKAIHGHIVAQGELMGRYQRKK